MTNNVILSVEGVSKSFLGTKALNNMRFVPYFAAMVP